MSRNSNAPQQLLISDWVVYKLVNSHLLTSNYLLTPNHPKHILAKFQAERGTETSDDKGSNDMTSKAEHKQKSDASTVEFCRRSLAGSNVCHSLADLRKIMKLRGVGADDVKEVRKIVQHLFTNVV